MTSSRQQPPEEWIVPDVIPDDFVFPTILEPDPPRREPPPPTPPSPRSPTPARESSSPPAAPPRFPVLRLVIILAYIACAVVLIGAVFGALGAYVAASNNMADAVPMVEAWKRIGFAVAGILPIVILCQLADVLLAIERNTRSR